MLKRKRYSMLVLMIFQTLFFLSCKDDTLNKLNGLWINEQYDLLEFRNDTLFETYSRYKFKIEGDNIFLLKELRYSGYEDRNFCPHLFASIHKQNDGSILLKMQDSTVRDFKKLKLESNKELQKFQITIGYDRKIIDFEIDKLGNAFISEKYSNLKSFAFKISAQETKKIFALASIIDFQDLKEEYSSSYDNSNPIGLYFTFKNKNIHTSIRDMPYEVSYQPLYFYFYNKLYWEYVADSLKYKKVENKIFDSRMALSSDTMSRLYYLRLFDTVNYKSSTFEYESLNKIVIQYCKIPLVMKRVYKSPRGISYNFTIDSLGKIKDIYFEEYIEINPTFYSKIKNIKANPAVFNGKAINDKRDICSELNFADH